MNKILVKVIDNCGEREMKLVLPGSIKSKKNSKRPVPMPCSGKTSYRFFYKKRGWTFVRIGLIPSSAYQKWEKQAREELKIQWRRPPIATRLHIRAIAYIKGPMPDLSGVLESVGDCCEGILFENDKLISSWDGSRVYRDKDNPRTELEISKWEESDTIQ